LKFRRNRYKEAVSRKSPSRSATPSTTRRKDVDQDESAANDDDNDAAMYTCDIQSSEKPPSGSDKQVAAPLSVRKALSFADINSSSPSRQRTSNFNQSPAKWVRPPPTTPYWPSKPVEMSSEQWVQKMRESKGIVSVRKEVELVPRFYPTYQLLEPLDLIITVEHCFNCKHHSMTLRHDPQDYVNYADAALLMIAKKLHGTSIDTLARETIGTVSS
jgi:hypothetical protein